MMRPSWLDAMVERFQHNWETNPQYRAVISGVAGLVTIVGLCAVLGVAFSFASMVGNSIGGGAGNNNNSFVTSSGPNSQATSISFPLITATPWPQSGVPNAAPLPASGTPQPTATPVPTATLAPTPTPCKSGCGGGPGHSVIITGISPIPFTNGTQVTVSVQTDTANTQFQVFIIWPTGATQASGGFGTTDGSGSGSASLNGTIPGGCPGGTLILWIHASNGAQSSRYTYGC